MTIMKFDEYLNSKGKMEEKPSVRIDGDCIDPETMPNAPQGGGKPYSAKDKKNKKSDKGLAYEGDDELNYQPQVDGGKEKAPAKLPTVESVALISKVVSAATKNPLVIETLVRQLKNNGLLGVVVAETLNHKETFKHLSEVMAHESYGPDLCTKLVRAMNEEVAPPFGDQLSDEDEKDLNDVDSTDEKEGEDDLGDQDEMDMNDLGDEGDIGPEGLGDEGDVGPEGLGDEGDINAEVEPEVGPHDIDDEMGPAVQNFQRALMKAYMRRMMGKL
jgi:hypothetical protein